MDNHGIENAIPFFFRPSSYSPLYEKEIQYFYSNYQSVSSCFTDQKPKEVLLNTHAQKYSFLITWPPQTAARAPTWLDKAAHIKEQCEVLYVWPSPPLLLLSENSTKTGFNPSLSVPTTSCSQSHGCTSRPRPNTPISTQRPAQPLPWIQEQCPSAAASQVYRITDRKGKVLIPTWLKLMLPLNTTQRYDYLT